jgi:hypothetical protein
MCRPRMENRFCVVTTMQEEGKWFFWVGQLKSYLVKWK